MFSGDYNEYFPGQRIIRPGNSRNFDNSYQCFSMAMVNKAHLNDGDKILLPPSALNALTRMHVDYPMLFEISNLSCKRKTHCGVIEFTAEEGMCHLPYQMMQNILVSIIDDFYI